MPVTKTCMGVAKDGLLFVERMGATCIYRKLVSCIIGKNQFVNLGEKYFVVLYCLHTRPLTQIQSKKRRNKGMLQTKKE